VLPFDDNERKILDDIFNQTYNRLIEAGKNKTVTDHDAIISSVLEFVERVLPKILACYKGEEYENKCKGIAASLRISISSIMPFDKFMQLMELKEMKILDILIKDLEHKGEADDENKLGDLFKKTDAPRHIYT
jgi:hypothetical protein